MRREEGKAQPNPTLWPRYINMMHRVGVNLRGYFGGEKERWMECSSEISCGSHPAREIRGFKGAPTFVIRIQWWRFVESLGLTLGNLYIFFLFFKWFIQVFGYMQNKYCRFSKLAG